jgi:hypothetical protein
MRLLRSILNCLLLFQMEGVTTKQLPTNQANLSLYPNPSNDQLTIKYNINEAGPVSIIIIDAQGRVLLYSTEGMTNAGGSYHNSRYWKIKTWHL